MKVAFTGHRNKLTKVAELEAIASSYPGAVWVHGGAQGFDTQVSEFARSHGIIEEVIRPDYSTHGRPAPLIRNRQIVDTADVLYACYDGRKSGGTYHTIKYADKRIPVHVLSPVQN